MQEGKCTKKYINLKKISLSVLIGAIIKILKILFWLVMNTIQVSKGSTHMCVKR